MDSLLDGLDFVALLLTLAKVAISTGTAVLAQQAFRDPLLMELPISTLQASLGVIAIPLVLPLAIAEVRASPYGFFGGDVVDFYSVLDPEGPSVATAEQGYRGMFGRLQRCLQRPSACKRDCVGVCGFVFQYFRIHCRMKG